MSNQEELLSEIRVLSDSIRKKNLAFKVGMTARNRYLEDTFRPIIDPLNKLNDSVLKSSISPRKEEEELEENKLYSKKIETESSDLETESVSKTSESSETSERRGDEEEEEEEEHKTDKEESDSNSQDETESPTNISILSREIGNKGPLSRKYILKMLHGARARPKYHVYGARLEKQGLQIGDSKLLVDDNDNINIKDQVFKGTAGLFELIFEPIPKKYSKNDLKNFKTICMITNSHRKGYSPSTPIHRNRSEKYKEIIAKLFSKYRGKHRHSMGKGMTMKSVYDTNVIYYNNVNKLVDRMRLIYESIQAGHTGLNNEMVALTEELKSRGYIA